MNYRVGLSQKKYIQSLLIVWFFLYAYNAMAQGDSVAMSNAARKDAQPETVITQAVKNEQTSLNLTDQKKNGLASAVSSAPASSQTSLSQVPIPQVPLPQVPPLQVPIPQASLNYGIPDKKVSNEGDARVATESIVGKLGGGLVFVVGCILALAWAARRFGIGTTGLQSNIRVVSSISLGGREKAVVVDVDGEQVLLGVAPGRVNFLHHLRSHVPVDPSNPLRGLSEYETANKNDANNADEYNIEPTSRDENSQGLTSGERISIDGAFDTNEIQPEGFEQVFNNQKKSINSTTHVAYKRAAAVIDFSAYLKKILLSGKK